MDRERFFGGIDKPVVAGADGTPSRASVERAELTEESALRPAVAPRRGLLLHEHAIDDLVSTVLFRNRNRSAMVAGRSLPASLTR